MAIQHLTPHRHSATPYLALNKETWRPTHATSVSILMPITTAYHKNIFTQTFLHTQLKTHTVGRSISNFYGQNTQQNYSPAKIISNIQKRVQLTQPPRAD
jgi:hypothetical protein